MEIQFWSKGHNKCVQYLYVDFSSKGKNKIFCCLFRSLNPFRKSNMINYRGDIFRCKQSREKQVRASKHGVTVLAPAFPSLTIWKTNCDLRENCPGREMPIQFLSATLDQISFPTAQ